MKIEKKNLLKLIIGLVLIGLLIYKIGFLDIINVLKKVSIYYLLPIPLILFISYSLNTLNIKILLNSINKEVSFLKLLKYYTLSWSIGLFTFGRIGEFSMIYFLKKENINLVDGLAVSIIDKFISLIVLFILGSIGALFFWGADIFLKLVIFFICGMILIYFVLNNNILRKIIKYFIPEKYVSYFSECYNQIQFYLKNRKKVLFYNFIITNIKWAINFLVFYFIFLAFGVKLGYIYIVLIASITMLISYIPISIDGLGTKQVVGVLLFKEIGVFPSIALGVYIINSFIRYLISVVVIGFFGYKETKGLLK